MALNIPCASKVDCVESPLANLTSEGPDSEVFVGVYFPPVEPPLARSWVGVGCGVSCVSYLSQEDADLCAARNAQTCTGVEPPTPRVPPVKVFDPPFEPPVEPPPPPPPVNPPPSPCNVAQTCCFTCPDGTEFCYTVPACTFNADTVATANAIAYGFACLQAKNKSVCMNGNVPGCCVGEPYVASFGVHGGTSPFSWSLVSGVLPAGLTGAVQLQTRSFSITGTPTEPVNQTFVVRAVDSLGNFMQKTFTIYVLAITSGTPPAAEVGVEYSFQFTAQGGILPYNFALSSGSLPSGLTLTEDGLLSGLPTTEQEVNFSVSVSDSG